jgi:hypothetical protein
MSIANIDNYLEIKPTYAKPRGFLKLILYVFLIIGIPSFFVGGFILVILSVCSLFIVPKNIAKNYPISFSLTEQGLTAYEKHRQAVWTIPWCDIESLYLVSYNWAFPTSLALRLNNFSNYQESMKRNQAKRWRSKIIKFFSNSIIMRFSRLFCKADVELSYMYLDRPAKEFTQLLYTYMEMYS